MKAKDCAIDRHSHPCLLFSRIPMPLQYSLHLYNFVIATSSNRLLLPCYLAAQSLEAVELLGNKKSEGIVNRPFYKMRRHINP